MKQRRLMLAIATVLASSPFVANAAVTLSSSGATGTTAWTSELSKDDTAFVLPDDGSTTDALSIQTTVGFGFPTGTTRFVRLDLSEGAKFKGEPDCSVVTPIPVGSSCSYRTGGNNQSFVTFNLSTGDAVSDETMPSGQGINFTFDLAGEGVRVVSNNTVTIRYSLHNNDVSVDATNQSTATAVLNEKTGDYVEFEPVINITPGVTQTLTASVATGFLAFTGGDTGIIGKFNYPSPSGILTVDATGADPVNTPATIAQAISASTLTVTGDFKPTQDFSGTTALGTYTTAPNRVFLDTVTPFNCASADSPAASVSDTEATFNLGTTAIGGEVAICIKANGITQITPATFSGNISFTANDGYSVNAVNLEALGEIIQDGTVIDTPYITKTAGYISRVILTNTGNKDAPYVATPVTDAGGTATAGTAATGVIPAGANIQLNAADLVDFSAKPRGAIRFVITAPNQTIQGIYQTVNLATGDAQSVVLERSGGGDGK